MAKNSRFGGGWAGMGGFSVGFAVGCMLTGALLTCAIFKMDCEKEGLHNKLAELEAEKVDGREAIIDEPMDEPMDEPIDKFDYFGLHICDLTFDCMCAKCQRERAIDNMLKSMGSINRNVDEITNLIEKIMCNLGITTNKEENSK